MCDIINLTPADIKMLKKNNNSKFYDCVWGLQPISTEYLHKVKPNKERLLYIQRDILKLEDESQHDFINDFFNDIFSRM